MNNEIKKGDKVRIANNAPCEYRYGFNYRLRTQESEVVGLDDDGYMAAIVPMCVNDKDLWFQIPTKYLVKVDADAKEPKFRVGDKVRKKKWDKDTTISYVEWHGTWQTYVYRFAEQEYGFNCHKEVDITLVSRRAKEPKFKAGDCVKISFEWGELPADEKLVIKRLETIDCRKAYMYSIEGYGGTVIESMLHPYTEPTAPTIKIGDRVCCYNILHLKGSKKEDYMGIVTSITSMGIMVKLDDGGTVLGVRESDLELVQPTEQTEAEEDARIRLMEAELDEFRKAELDRVLHPEKCHTYEVTIDNVAMDWKRYAANLAKEIVLKTIDNASDKRPSAIAEYATDIAKAIVETLKRK